MKITNGIETVKNHRRTTVANINTSLTAYTEKKRIQRINRLQAKLDKMVADAQYVNQFKLVLVADEIII